MDETRTFIVSNPVKTGPGIGLLFSAFPNVDDHLVEPEVSRDEIVGGRRVVASPSEPPQADQCGRLNYLLQAHVAFGYRVACGLLTRYDEISDFASDACVRKEGLDSATGRRHLQEIAFLVLSEAKESLATEKAERMHRRGVRRIFAVWVDSREVGEWSHERQNWRLMDVNSRIEDPCFVAALEIAALFDAQAGDNAVVEALAAKGDASIRRLEDDAASAKGAARALLKFLVARGLEVSEAQRQEILRCQDLERLDRWLDRAATASSAAEVLAEP